MDFNRLTIKSQEAVGAAQELARRSGNPEIYPEHLVLALLDQELPRTLVERAGASVADVRARAEAALSAKPSVQGAATQQPRISTAFAEVLDHAEEEMRKREDESPRELVHRLEKRLDEALKILNSIGERKSIRESCADAMERQHAAEHLVQQAEIAMFREE